MLFCRRNPRRSRALDLLDDILVPVVDVDGQVEMKSLVLFFMGNEKSLRGQQLTSMVGERRKTLNCRYLCVRARMLVASVRCEE